MTAKLEVRGVEMTFPGPPPVRALEPVDLDVRAGEFVCLLGPSGCGKSTFLQIIAGFLRPSAGTVAIDGQPVTGPDRKRIFVFQERGVFPWLTVAENIAFGLADLPRAEQAKRVAAYVELVGLSGCEHQYPHELSGGMKQRVEVARALAVDPDMLFLDEPFGALDSITRLTMRAELLRIWQAAQQTILFVTHDVEESVQLADRVVVMSARPAATGGARPRRSATPNGGAVGSIQRIVDIDIPRPRDLSAPRYLELRDSILAEIGLAHQI